MSAERKKKRTVYFDVPSDPKEEVMDMDLTDAEVERFKKVGYRVETKPNQ